MGLAIGIVGLPNVGKSTLFNALTNAGAVAANYPFATIAPNTGVVAIPDPRVAQLAAIAGSKKATPATVTFVDIAGLVEGASTGEGLGNRFLGNIREVDAICHVVRAFDSGDVAHVEGNADPKRDIDIVETELALADLETIDKRLPRLQKESTVDRDLQPRVRLLEEAREVVASGRMIYSSQGLIDRRSDLSDLHLLTSKPVIYVFNCDEEVLGNPEMREELSALVAPNESVFLDAQFEAELATLDQSEQEELLDSAGHQEPGLNIVIRAAYRTLGLQSYLTAGDKEARAWTITAGWTAPRAAGVIHGDFERGFIAAEVVDFPLLVEAGSWAAARSKGLIRTEGKSYVMRPDDVVEFRFNV